MKHIAVAFLLAAFFFQNTVSANDPAYELRRTNYRATAVANLNDNALVIQAFENQPLDQPNLNYLI
jgi:hypothetical protein